jgi:hypothetical protein
LRTLRIQGVIHGHFAAETTATLQQNATATLQQNPLVKNPNSFSGSYRPLPVDNSTASTNRKTEKNAECTLLDAQDFLVSTAGIFTTEMMTAETRAAERS